MSKDTEVTRLALKKLGVVLTDRGSKYAVSGGPCASPAEAKAFIKSLCKKKKFAKAKAESYERLAVAELLELLQDIQEGEDDSPEIQQKIEDLLEIEKFKQIGP